MIREEAPVLESVREVRLSRGSHAGMGVALAGESRRGPFSERLDSAAPLLRDSQFAVTSSAAKVARKRRHGDAF